MIAYVPTFGGDAVLTPVRYGARGQAVSSLQAALTALGYNVGPAGVDGRFGIWTQQAVMTFQRDHGLPQTGDADAATIEAVTQAGTPPPSLNTTDAGSTPEPPPVGQSIISFPERPITVVNPWAKILLGAAGLGVIVGAISIFWRRRR